MLKRTIKYVDYNGVERSEDFYFNLTESEITEKDMKTGGGLLTMIDKITSEQDRTKLMDLFKELLVMSYGEKSPDGKYFYKTKEIQERFTFTEAYNILFMELCTDADAAAKFFNAVVPNKEDAVKK